MNYLILECPDSKSSEYQFWEKIIGFSGVIICSGGNMGMFKVLNELKVKLCTDDNLYVCYDTINKYSDLVNVKKKVYININRLKAELSTIAKNYSVICYMLKDLCFESMVYRLHSVLGCYNDKFKLQSILMQAYSDTSNSYYDILLSVLFKSVCQNCTCEQYMATLLHNVTYKSGLCVSKTKLGKCWLSDCGYKQINNEYKLAYITKDMTKGFCGFVNNDLCVLCGHLFNNKSNMLLFDNIKNTYKQDMILSDLCNGDWHNLFKKIC